ncbi:MULTISPECIES: PspA-associated protein PspAB [unclassified Nocardioides]|uniref:PspA-associated protein PspAB n=1 Tax=unclassified Nocardioides TaxID=2615069 RepID=UPI00362022D2
MGFWDTITGRSRPKAPRLDALFHVPSAAITLETSLGLRPTGTGSVCYRAATGNAFQQVQSEVVELLNADPDQPEVEITQDEFGFTWLVVRDDPDIADLCTDLHAVNTSLEAQGFGPGLLCSLIPFEGADGRRVGLVYLYKQGTFYPFAPQAGTTDRQRDNLLEIQLRDTLAGELPMEQDLGRWLAVWGAPGV